MATSPTTPVTAAMSREPSALLLTRLHGARRIALGLGLGALLVSLIRIGSADFFRSWIFGYLFWLGFPLGSLAVLMLHHMVGGEWGFAIRRTLEASIRTLPLMIVLFLPVLPRLGSLYPWADPAAVEASSHLAHKTPYLNVGFFLARAAFYFLVWCGLAFILDRLSREQDHNRDPRLLRRLQLLSGGGLVLFGLTVTFASFDWGMSLEPLWFSSIYGAMFMVGDVLSGLAAAILVAALLVRTEPIMEARITGTTFNHLGNLLLAFVMLWAYMAFSQYLIIWSGNIAEETTWYASRQHGGWQQVALLLIVFHFAVPFLLLLSRQSKQRPRVLMRIVLGLLVMRFIDMTWLIVPAFHPDGFALKWLDLTVPVGIGGIWVATFLWQLPRRPLLPLDDPRYPLSEARPVSAAAPAIGTTHP